MIWYNKIIPKRYKRNEQNQIITHQREVELREQGTPDSIRFGISLIEKEQPQTKNEMNKVEQ